MSGPVWRFDATASGTCDACLRGKQGLYVEGEIVDNVMGSGRRICEACYERWPTLVIAGEDGAHVAGPAYARKA